MGNDVKVEAGRTVGATQSTTATGTTATGTTATGTTATEVRRHAAHGERLSVRRGLGYGPRAARGRVL